MSILIRGWRNAFRNVVRSVGTIAVLALVVALAISMLLARQAVNSKINSVKASTGTTIPPDSSVARAAATRSRHRRSTSSPTSRTSPQ